MILLTQLLYSVYKKMLVFEIQIRHILLNSSDKNCTYQMNSIDNNLVQSEIYICTTWPWYFLTNTMPRKWN